MCFALEIFLTLCDANYRNMTTVRAEYILKLAYELSGTRVKPGQSNDLNRKQPPTAEFHAAMLSKPPCRSAVPTAYFYTWIRSALLGSAPHIASVSPPSVSGSWRFLVGMFAPSGSSSSLSLAPSPSSCPPPPPLPLAR